jgi:hypothetical protein
VTIWNWLNDWLTSSDLVSDQAVYEFGCIAQDNELPLDYGNDWHLAELLDNHTAKLLKQSENGHAIHVVDGL